MAAPRVRADHDGLKQIAADLGAQAGATRESLQQLQRHAELLRSGDWVGRGANAFYVEMGDAVLPAFRRLAAALELAQQMTLLISLILREAEIDAARVLAGQGSAADAPPDTAAVEAGPAFIALQKPPSARTLAQARARRTAAAEDAAVEKMLSIFELQVRDLARRSPTLRAQMLALQKLGIQFLTGPRSQTIEPFITIAQSLTGGDAVAMIAHEVGHVISNAQEISRVPETPSMTRDQYVELNVANNLRNEALAQFNAVQVRAELLAAGAGDIGIPGTQDAGFQRVYTEYANGRITKDQAIERMGPVMGAVVRDAGPPPKTYRQFAIDHFRKDWDTHIAPTRRP